MPALIKREIKSLSKIRNFGLVTANSRAISLKENLKQSFFPPPAYSYALRIPSRVNIKKNIKLKNILLIVPSNEQIDKGYISGICKVVEPNIKKYSLEDITYFFGKDRTFYGVELSKYCSLHASIMEYRRGTIYTYNFKIPHQIEIALVKRLEWKYNGY